MSMPLLGIRVMDLGAFIAAPYATSILASLGAEVVKVEPLPPGEAYRRGRDVADEYFVQYNAGKKSLSIDLKNPLGRTVVDRLLETCDVLVHNLRPGKAEKLDLGFEQLAPRLPQLVYAAVSGFGNVGPLSQRPGYDSVAQSISGIFSLCSPTGTFQAGGLSSISDLTTGVVTALGVCAKLADRARSGTGGLVETSLFEVSTMLSTEGMAYQAGNLKADALVNGRSDTEYVPYSARSQAYCLVCADGAPVTLAVGDSEEQWSALAQLATSQSPTESHTYRTLDYGQRVREYPAIREALQRSLSHVDSETLLSQLRELGVPATLVRTYREAVTRSSGEVSQVPQMASGQVDLLNPGFRIDGEWPSREPKVPRIGEDTREILSSLGLGDSIEELAAEQAIHCAPQLDRCGTESS
ncbi:CaiB/BaiF CoA-transferase family protein [Rhodococcus opacus]|uniref:CaiB/BaiF CoA transferase family protein n=1 Tax=Rhodococcus opacus TaxID=37919 RepID=UPI001469B2B1|nr:CaiB/BaiF CoA-transferase family protein [Rhodococcus opacus]MDV7088957.1 CaiB/BaiF CoA-transferase family protein [Rhodococcus opacus]WKN60243.1 CaiB/BaiF CoA-transferase family protein [Rhodococcus opacus]